VRADGRLRHRDPLGVRELDCAARVCGAFHRDAESARLAVGRAVASGNFTHPLLVVATHGKHRGAQGRDHRLYKTTKDKRTLKSGIMSMKKRV
jgi:hypothetical protein